MKRTLLSLFTLGFCAMALLDEAQAARLGGGRSVGAQRQITAPAKQATPPTQQQQPAGNRWLAPLAGLAAGLGLGWLFSQGGFGAVAGALMMALLAGAAVFVLMRLLSGQRARTRPLQYAGLGNETVVAPPPSQVPGNADAKPDFRSQLVPNVPAGFDESRFLAEAKRNFLRLQEANDRADLEILREVATPEMFDALKGDLAGRKGAQQTDVITLNAELLELVTEGSLHWASVRFSGSIREEALAAAAPFEEIWNLQKPADGSSGWLVAGIQQAH
jgi:predicted lipid-binding transport protein (Tim44 family)